MAALQGSHPVSGGRHDGQEAITAHAAQQQMRSSPAPPPLPPPDVDLGCLSGIRAVSSLGTVAFHSMIYWQLFLTYEAKHHLTAYSPVVKIASAGMVWVDVLLVLSAMLAALHLVPALEDRRPTAPSCRHVVLSYWRRRALRILPAYLVTNLLAAIALGPTENVSPEAAAARWLHFYTCPSTLWANLLLVQNFIGNRACAIHLWTIALQAQFYLAFPLLLCALRPRTHGFRARLATVLTLLVAGGTAWRLQAAWQAGFLELPVADFAVDQPSQLSWANMLHATYLPTASRVAELAVGATLGLLLCSPKAVELAHRRRSVIAAGALCLQAAYLHLLLKWHLLFRPPGGAPWPLTIARLHIALLSFGSPFMVVVVAATLLALMLHADPLHALAARVLGAPAWTPLATLSYCLYLLHEQARLWVAVYLLPPGMLPRLIAERPHLGLAAVMLGTVAAGYACALPVYWLVERRWVSRKA